MQNTPKLEEVKSYWGEHPCETEDWSRQTLSLEYFERLANTGTRHIHIYWLADDKLRMLDKFVLDGNRFAQEYFDLDYVKRLARSRTYLSTDSSERLWRILTVCVWGQVFQLS